MHYLLIHGSWHGAWCWEKLTPYLQGHQITCLELPGSGELFDEIDKVTFPLLVASVRKTLEELPSPITVVAHSFAGLLIAGLAEEYIEKIEHIYYLTAWLPREGYSLIDIAMSYNDSELPSIFIKAPKPNWTAIDSEGAKSVFYHDCSQDDQHFAASRIKPKNALPDRTKLSAVLTNYALAKSTYVLCTEDKVVRPSSQQDMAERFGFTKEQIIYFPSGHAPFLSKPRQLAELILRR